MVYLEANEIKIEDSIENIPKSEVTLAEKEDDPIADNSAKEIQIDEHSIKNARLKFNMSNENLNILLAIGGSGPTKRIPAKTFLSFIEKINEIKKCKF